VAWTFPGIYIRQRKSPGRKQRDPPQSSPCRAGNAVRICLKFAGDQTLPKRGDHPTQARAQGTFLLPRPTQAQLHPLRRPRAGAASRASSPPLGPQPSVGPPLPPGRIHRRFKGKRRERGGGAGGGERRRRRGRGIPPSSHVVRVPVNRARRRVSQRNTKAAGKRRRGEFPEPGRAPDRAPERPAATMGLRRPKPRSQLPAGPASPPGPGRPGSA
jgi:hypothetical protein